MRTDYLLNKKNYESVLDEKRKLETELNQIKNYLNDINKQLIKAKEIIKQKNNEISNIKQYNQNIKSNLDKLNLNLEETKNEKNNLNIELNIKIQNNKILTEQINSLKEEINMYKNKLFIIEDKNIKQFNLSNKYLNEINNSKKIINKYEIANIKNETLHKMNNNKILELEKEIVNLKQVIKENNILNKSKISQLLQENNNLKKENDYLKNENKKLNELLNLKKQKISSESSKDIKCNKILEHIKEECFINNETKWNKLSNNPYKNNIFGNKENYYIENNNNFDNIFLINKKIENLNKKNEKIFKTIYQNSKSFSIEREKI